MKYTRVYFANCKLYMPVCISIMFETAIHNYEYV